MSGNNLRAETYKIIKNYSNDSDNAHNPEEFSKVTESAVNAILKAVAEALPEPSKGVSILNDLTKEIEYEMEDWDEGYNAYRTEVLKILEGK